MKKFLKILGIMILVVACGIGAVFYVTRGMVHAADGFFRALTSGDVDAASVYLSKDFMAETSATELEAYGRANGFYEYSDSSWLSRSFENGRGEISGSIKTTGGMTIPLTITFIKEDGQWKIYHISKPSTGISSGDERSVTLAVPPEGEMVQMVRGTMAVFADAINADDMTGFYDQCSGLWKSQTSPEALDDVFKAFMERDIDLSVLANFSPRFIEAPAIDEDGVLRVKGDYSVPPNVVHFSQSYIYEGLGWKLFGINVNIE